MRRYCLLLLTLALCSTACRKKDLPAPASPSVTTDSVKKKGTIKIAVENRIGDKKLVLGEQYRLSTGDTLSVNVYNYYISKLVFTDIRGNTFTEPESYHLLMQSDAKTLNILVENVPFAEYKNVSFLIGVDSARNVSGVQSGDLDPQLGMFWDWNSGYIMAKLEGRSPQSSFTDNTVSFHISGFKDPYNTVQAVLLEFPDKTVVSEQATPTVHISSDLSVWFKPFIFPGFSNLPIINKQGKDALTIARNYKNMMQVESVEHL